MGKNNSQIKLGALLSYAQMGLHIIISLAFTPIMIRLLGQSEYGLYNTVSSTISMLSILRLGFNNSYIRYYSKYRKNEDTYSIFKLNGVFLGLFSLIGIICLTCGLYLSDNLGVVFSDGLTAQEYQVARALMILLTVNLAISFPMSVFSNIISANEKFAVFKALDAVKTVLGPLVTLPLLLMGYGSIGMVVVTLLVALIVDAISIFYVTVKLDNKFYFKKPESKLLKDLISYTSFIALELIVDQINWNIDKVLLARYKGTAMVAIYSVGYSLYTYYQTFSSTISGLFVPRIHKIVNENENNIELRKALTAIFTKVGRIQFLILALISTGIFFFGRFFITEIWAGKEYSDAYYVALLLIFPASIALIQNLGIEIQRAQYKHQFRSVAYFFMAIANLLMSIILCQIYGAIGAAIGTAVSLILANGLIMNIYYHKKCNIDIMFFWSSILKLSKGIILPLLYGVVVCYLGVVNSIISFIANVVIYCCAYALSMWKFGMNSSEKALVISTINRITKR